jgi:hypothetical protein
MERQSRLKTDMPFSYSRRRGMVTVLARLCLLAMGVVFVAGCGQKGPHLVPVSGLVMLDGEPLASAIVAFEQPGELNMATGVTKDDGRFELAIHKMGKGATPGPHRVQINRSESDAPGKTRWISPKEYASFDTSGLSVDVTPTQHTFTFELSSQGPAGTK